MSDYYILIDNSDRYHTYVKGFQCSKCMLPETILAIDYFRYSLMSALYPDYNNKTALEYERKWKSGEISGQLQNFVREIIANNDGSVYGFVIKSIADTTTGFTF